MASSPGAQDQEGWNQGELSQSLPGERGHKFGKSRFVITGPGSSPLAFGEEPGQPSRAGLGEAKGMAKSGPGARRLSRALRPFCRTVSALKGTRVLCRAPRPRSSHSKQCKMREKVAGSLWPSS